MTVKDTPKISGLLHNCALNCTLPILLKGIDSLAELESKNKLSAISADPLVKSYELLKNCFNSYYQISKPFSYQNFSNFLNQEMLSFYAKEIILAPVLRSFMAKNCEHKGDIPNLTQIQSSGSYVDLHHNEAYQLFYKYFGISIKVYEFVSNKNSENSQENYVEIPYRPTPIIKFFPFDTVSNISLYLKNEHYELYPHENLSEAGSSYTQEIENLPSALKQVHDALNFSVNSHETEQALTDLRESITLLVNKFSKEPKVQNSVSPPKESSKSPCWAFSIFNKKKQSTDPRIIQLIEKYFGPQTWSKSNVGGVFGAYLNERSKTFALRDYLSQCLSCIFCCFGYQTESQEREIFLVELLVSLKNVQCVESLGDVSDKITKGKSAFLPREESGKEYRKSLAIRLDLLQQDLYNLITPSDENIATI
ncbi:MAG: hypothetical protein H0U57_08300 [Tatlockia sp.]|nr:hypothetical protein [Tatlockia sp.]